MAEDPVVVGIDVSQDTLDVTVGLPAPERFRQPRAELDELVARLARYQPAAIVLEATGGLEAPVVAALMAAGLPTAVINPRHSRAFAQSMNQLAKTDRLDADVLAEFGLVLLTRGKLRFETAGAHERDELAALVRYRQRVSIDLVREQNRRSRAMAVTRPHIERTIGFLKDQLRTLDRQIDQLIRQSPAWKADVDLLRSIPGIGRITGPFLVACLSELGQLDRGKIAALVGVAPINHDSGQMCGHRGIWRGRAHVRRALYMATQAAIIHNPVIRAQKLHLIATGKKQKVAIIACTRKLLLIANAIMRTRVPWSSAIATA